jgi:hypothetical protein
MSVELEQLANKMRQNSNVRSYVVNPESLLEIIVQWSIQIILFCDFGLWQEPWTGRQYTVMGQWAMVRYRVFKNSLRLNIRFLI